jgi:hypothetical protein
MIDCLTASSTFHAVADLGDTAALEPVQVLDSLGNAFTGVTLRT